MDIWNIAKTVGAGIISAVVPGGPAIVGVINEFLPDEKKLPETATGNDAINAISGLPPDKKASLMEKQFDVDITQIVQANTTIRTMLESDAKNPHSTRPYIAKHSFHVIAITTGIVILVWAYGVMSGKDALVKTVMDGWPFIVGVTGPLVTLLLSYFGVLKTENKNRLDAANGAANPSGIAGALSVLLKK